MYKKFFKPLLDFLLAMVAIFIFSPVFLTIIIALFIINQGKVFFLQKRPGKDQKPFYIIKFKTMTEERDKKGNLLPDNQRITKFGNFLRSVSLDELPQLINILKGEMSLIGPRPLLFKYIPLYSKDQLQRHDLRPGITGLAQVSGRNNISWKKKFELDIQYVQNVSYKLDFKIICKTFYKVLLREGVNQSDDRPMEPFNGFN